MEYKKFIEKIQVKEQKIQLLWIKNGLCWKKEEFFNAASVNLN